MPRLLLFPDVGQFACPGAVSDIQVVPVAPTMICLRGSSWFAIFIEIIIGTHSLVNRSGVIEEEMTIPLKDLIVKRLGLSAVAGTTYSGSFLEGARSQHSRGPNAKKFFK